MKFCPLKFSRPNPDDWGCEGSSCEWWEEQYGKCSLTVFAFLKGIEDARQEARESVELYKESQ